MRRLILLLLTLALALPVAALAERAAPGDSSLVVSNADGVLTIKVKGVIFGHFDRGKMTVLDYKTDNLNALPTVSGAKIDVRGARANVVYSGNDVRFLFPSGKYTLKFEGADIDLSAVGSFSLQYAGKNLFDDGTISINGQKPTALPATAASGGALAVTADKVTAADKTTGGSLSSGSGH